MECRPYQKMEADGAIAWDGPAERRIAIPRVDNKRDRMFNRFQLVDAETGVAISLQRYADDFDEMPALSHRDRVACGS